MRQANIISSVITTTVYILLIIISSHYSHQLHGHLWHSACAFLLLPYRILHVLRFSMWIFFWISTFAIKHLYAHMQLPVSLYYVRAGEIIAACTRTCVCVLYISVFYCAHSPYCTFNTIIFPVQDNLLTGTIAFPLFTELLCDELCILASLFHLIVADSPGIACVLGKDSTLCVGKSTSVGVAL